MIASTSPLNVGLIGLGRWGSNYVSTLTRMPNVSLVRVAGRDYQSAQVEAVNGVTFTEDWCDLCLDRDLEGVIVATPPNTHYNIVRFALDAGLPVLVEKPFTLSLAECEELCNLASRKNVLCVVNYIHLYSMGYRHLKSLSLSTGRVRKIFTENFAYGPFRGDVPVLLDWGSHDLAMCIDLLNETPSAVRIENVHNLQSNSLGKVFTLDLSFRSGVTVKCTFGNGSEFKRRNLAVLCDDGCFFYDGFSEGLAMDFSNSSSKKVGEYYSLQPSPLECAVDEFVRSVRGRLNSHPSLTLAPKVHKALASVSPI